LSTLLGLRLSLIYAIICCEDLYTSGTLGRRVLGLDIQELMDWCRMSVIRRVSCIQFPILLGLGFAVLVIRILIRVVPARGSESVGQRQDLPALVRIDLRQPDDLDRIAALNLPVYAHLTAPDSDPPDTDYLLAVLAPQNQSRLQSLDLAWTVLDPDARGAVYYLVESGHPRMTRRVAADKNPAAADKNSADMVFDILHDDGREAVGRLREGVPISAVDGLGLPVIRIGLEPIELAPRTTGVIPTMPLYDPVVADLLPYITADAVSGYVGGLSGEWPVLVGGQPYVFSTRHSYSGEPIAKATQYVYEHMQARGYDVYYHEYSLVGYTLRNVIGEKQGLVHPDQIFLLTAHLDSIAAVWPHDPAPGADDNASGAAALLVATDLLANLDFAYTVRFVFFTGEEQGMYGSYYYARDAFNAGEDILGVLNLDMIAWDAEGGPDIDLHSHLPGQEDDSDGLADLFAAVVDVYGLDLEPQIVENGGRFSDHSSFWDRGYAAILAIEDYFNADESPTEPHDWNPNYHTVNDRLSTLNLSYFREYVCAGLSAFVHLAGPMRALGGTITDASTAVPLSATVMAVGADGEFSDTTTGSGSYEIVLPTGFYTVTASADGYDAQTLVNVAVLTGTRTNLDFALESAIPPPPYDFNLVDRASRFGGPTECVTHVVTIINVGAQSDAYDLDLSPSAWTTTLPFTRSALLSPGGRVTVPVTVAIPPGAIRGDQDWVTLTVTSVYSPAHVGRIVLRTSVGRATYLPLMMGDLEPGTPAGPCVEGIANGGFESREGWEIPVTVYPAGYTTATAYGGSQSMRVGIVELADNVRSYSSARQMITIPTGTLSATLSFWLYPVSGETADWVASPRAQALAVERAALSGDAQYVLILDENDRWMDTLLWQRRNDGAWTFHRFDLGSYAGRAIKLQFGVYNDGADGVTALYVDDASLHLCMPAAPSP